MSSLSSLIVQREVATIRQVEEALARQVIYGGDLLTNLLEVARVDEEIVTELLAESVGMLSARPGELPEPTPRARALVPPEMAQERAMVPLTIEQDRLLLAVAEPLPAEMEEQLSFALGMPVEQRIALMVRIREAIAKAYGLPLERRMERLVGRLSGKAVASGSMPPLFSRPPQVTDLPRPPSAPPFRPSPGAGTPIVRVPVRRETSSGFPAPAPPRLPSPPPPLSPIPRPPSTHPSGMPREAPEAPERTTRPPALVQTKNPSARPIRRRRGPLTLEVAEKEVEEAEGRDALLDLFFEFSRQFFDYAALFLIHGDIAEGRDAFGVGAPRERVVGIGVPLDLPSLFATAREKKRAATGSATPDSLEAVLLTDLHRPPRGPLVVVPLLVRTRAVALLLGDFGDGGMDPGSAGEVASFAVTVGHAFEKIIVRRKLSGFIAGNTSTQAGRVDPSLVGSKQPPAPAPRLATPPPAPAVELPPPPEPEPEAPPPVEPIEPSPMAESVPLPPVTSESAETDVTTNGHASMEAAYVETPELGSAIVMAEAAREDAESGARAAPAARRGGAPPPKTEGVFAPPPAAVVAVRRPTGPPIPREDPPESQPRPDAPPSSQPEIAVSGVDDAAAQELLDEIEQETQWVADPAEYGREVPPPSQALAVPPHRPPSSRVAPATELPSVIIDMGQEYGALVDRLASSGADDGAEAELLRRGQAAMPAIMERFPGPINIDRATVSGENGGPRVGECGPILRLVAGQRRVALPFVVDQLGSADGEKRYWATFMLTELNYAEAAPALMGRLFDVEARTRRVARLAAAAIAKRSPHIIVDELEKQLASGDMAKRQVILDTVAELREPLAVPVLIGVLDDAEQLPGSSKDAAQTAYLALKTVTRQDFGANAHKWYAWWNANSNRHRIEWLIDALDHELSEMRRAAGEELKALTKEYFGFSSELPARERQRAQQRYRDWWVTEGRSKFRRR